MAIDFKSNINLGKNQLQNALLHPTATAPSSPSEGQVYFNTTAADKKLYVYDGSNWVDVTGDIRSISAGTGIGVTDGSGGDATVSLSHLGLESLTAISSENSDEIFMYDASAQTAAYLSVNTASGITIDSTNNDLKLDSVPNSSLSNSSITFTAGDGLQHGTGSNASTALGGTVELEINFGDGVNVGDNGELEVTGAGDLTDNTLVMWDTTTGGFVDSPLTDDGSAVTVGSSRNLIISGNLTVQGTTTTVDSNTVNIGDNILVLNADLGDSATPSADGGIEIKRGTETNAQFIWVEDGDYWHAKQGSLKIDTIPVDSSPSTSTKVAVTDSGSNGEIQYVTLDNLMAAAGFQTLAVSLDSDESNVTKSNNTYTVTHTMNTRDIIAQVIDMDSNNYETVMVEVQRPTTTTVKVVFAQSVSNGDYKLLLTKAG